MRTLTYPLFSLLAVSSLAKGAITVGSASLNNWTPFAGNYDFLSDQQTGQPSADIVGEGTNYGFYMAFDDNGASFSTDGDLAFRIRFDAPGDTKNPANFKSVVWVGIDADLSGAIDVFLGLSDSGNTTDLIIRDAGSGLNTSPSTTSISNTNYWIATANSSNYSYRAVNSASDGGTTNDITGTGDPDYYVSFVVPFQQIVNFLATPAGGSMTITDQSQLRYVVATSTQTNSLNQDLGGVDGGINSVVRWDAPGGGLTSVPEPSGGMLVLGSVLGGLLIRRRR